MQNDKVLFAGTNFSFMDDLRPAGFSAPDYRIPSLVTAKGNLVAAIDSASGGMDWGKIGISVKVSGDSGENWSDEIKVMSPPCCKAPVDGNDTTSAILMDPVMVVKDDVILMHCDMFPESKGLHDRSRLEKTDGYCMVDGQRCLMLFTREQSVKKLKKGHTKTGLNCYTLRADGYVYDPDGGKTRYYMPKNHDFAHAYETLGDLYYGDGEFLEKAPPLYPDSTGDIYVGNIYLSSDMPAFSENPAPVKKREYNEKYVTPETKAAPLRAAVTCYIWQTESRDGGLTWSQPVDITPQVKSPKDGKFFGTGPGIGICLSHQPEKAKNGRLLMPMYALGRAAVIYSDDSGKTWHRNGYSKNIDESQLMEQSDGTILCLGRQLKYGKTPLSVSHSGGQHFKRARACALYSVRCQKSILMLPRHGENGFSYPPYLDQKKEYFVSVHPSGHHGKDSSRTDGVLSVCEIADKQVKTIKDIPLKDKTQYAAFEKYDDFFAYSSIALLSGGEIGVFYEAYPSGCLVFKRVKL